MASNDSIGAKEVREARRSSMNTNLSDAVEEDMLTLGWHDICYKVPVADPSGKKGKKRNIDVSGHSEAVPMKTLIHPMSGSVKPGEMLAIMGSSGAGKSTMLDILAGRLESKNLEGAVSLNSEIIAPSEFRRQSGYVMQSDALFPMLTVRESFRYAAALRIADQTPAEREALVESTIKALNLQTCADTVVGDELVRGVSGGEKRRVSIGCDIIHQPYVIFLDEPTSGLDSTTALKIVENLQEIASRGRTIAVTIHQPSMKVFNCFSHALFLARGKVVYSGRVDTMDQYVTDVANRYNYDFNKFTNLPELFLEIIDAVITADEENGNSANGAAGDLEGGGGVGGGGSEAVRASNTRGGSTIATARLDDIVVDTSDNSAGSLRMRDAGKSSRLGAMFSSSRRAVVAREAESQGQGQENGGKQEPQTRLATYATSMPSEMYYLSHRVFTNILRTKELFFARLFLSIFIGLVMGSLFRDTDNHTFEGNRERVGYVIFTVAFYMFTSLEALPIFLSERDIFTREYSRGTYRAFSYLVATTVVYLPFMALLSVVYTAMSWFLIGLPLDAEAIFFNILAVFATLVVAKAFATMLSAIVNDPLTGNSMGSAMFANFFLFCGFFVRASDTPNYWIWFHYLSIFKYAYEPLAINILNHPKTGVDDATFLAKGGVDDSGNQLVTRKMILEEYDVDGVNKWTGVGATFAFFIFFSLMFYRMLITKHSGKRLA